MSLPPPFFTGGRRGRAVGARGRRQEVTLRSGKIPRGGRRGSYPGGFQTICQGFGRVVTPAGFNRTRLESKPGTKPGRCQTTRIGRDWAPNPAGEGVTEQGLRESDISGRSPTRLYMQSTKPVIRQYAHLMTKQVDRWTPRASGTNSVCHPNHNPEIQRILADAEIDHHPPVLR